MEARRRPRTGREARWQRARRENRQCRRPSAKVREGERRGGTQQRAAHARDDALSAAGREGETGAGQSWRRPRRRSTAGSSWWAWRYSVRRILPSAGVGARKRRSHHARPRWGTAAVCRGRAGQASSATSRTRSWCRRTGRTGCSARPRRCFSTTRKSSTCWARPCASTPTGLGARSGTVAGRVCASGSTGRVSQAHGLGAAAAAAARFDAHCRYDYVDVDGGPGLSMRMTVTGSHGHGVATVTFKETAGGHYVCHDLVVDSVAQSHPQRVVLVYQGHAL